MTTRVAVILRTKDRPRFLARALDDILRQQFQDWEAIVVNDGGDPAVVRAVVATVAERATGRIRVLDVVGAGGRCAAANQGIRTTSAPLVVLHDDDDLWHPEFLERTVAALDERPEHAGVMVSTEIVYEERHGDGWIETGREPYWDGLKDVNFTTLLEINRAVPISFLYRRTLHDEVGFYDESLDAVEDWDFYLKVTARHPIAFLHDEPLAYWMHRPTARGAEANSMSELAGLHDRADLFVRDAALRAWVEENGTGLPLYIAFVEKRLSARLDAQWEFLRHELEVLHPFLSGARRVRRAWRARMRRAR